MVYFYPVQVRNISLANHHRYDMRVYTDASCDIHYASFYIEGVRRLFGKSSVRFSSSHFKRFKHNNDYMAMVFEDRQGGQYRVGIDFGDSRTFKQAVYDWCDIYAKVNLTPDDHVQFPKSFPIGPAGPGIRIYSSLETVYHGAMNLLKAYTRIPNKRQYISDYKTQYTRRLPYSCYEKVGESKHDYVHFVCSLWKDDKETNDFRANFMNVVKGVEGLRFEGGFAPRPDHSVKGYEALEGKPFEPMDVYMRKIMDSLVVFNTPAVKKCHGWKLPEFLAWGKAIITTPMLRMLPAPLVDGEDVIVTDGSIGDLSEKIEAIMTDPALRRRLEQNARKYYDTYLTPERVISRILEKVGYGL